MASFKKPNSLILTLITSVSSYSSIQQATKA